MKNNNCPKFQFAIKLLCNDKSMEIIKKELDAYDIDNYKIIRPRASDGYVIKFFSLDTTSFYLDEALLWYFNQIGGYEPFFQAETIIKECQTVIDIWIDYSSVFPSLDISLNSLRFANAINAGISIDTHIDCGSSSDNEPIAIRQP